jgi:protein-disulfide isomerase
MQAGTVTGTPTFLINDKKLDQVVSWDQMEKALKAAGA